MSGSTPPAPGPPREFSMPDIVCDRLETGLDLRIIEQTGSPLVSAELVLDAGEGGLSGDRAGLSVLSAAALDGGTRSRSGSEMARALEQLGSGVAASAGWDDLTLSFSALPDRFEDVLGLLAERIREPSFPESELARVRDQRLAAIEQWQSDPSALASIAMMGEIFHGDVPYARPLAGTQDTVSTFGVAEVRGHADSQFQPEKGGIAVVGPLSAERISTSVKAVLGDWVGAPARDSRVRSAPRYSGQGVLILDRPGSVQSEIRLGHIGIARDSSDYFPLRVFNAVLGGTFTSRLNLNLRERNGFTYGVRSSFRARLGSGPFTVSTGVGTDSTVAAVRETVHEIRCLLQDGPTEDETSAVKEFMVGVFPLMMETSSQLAARLGELFPYRLPDDYHATWRDQISAITPLDALEAGRRNLRPEQLRVVVVGDASNIRNGLEGLDFGPVEVISAAEWAGSVGR